ncbi:MULTISPECIES: lytic transglycosylase domain-containing protein [unclassified Micromonospora]|uniref:lytic transglycosylase domain-containing protein n=1 Tax=unclassified Micromonospora TaxID=2617518 RepID=UPI001B360230|nr:MULTISPECIES: lytic transglycosylase domain-containing protein [unclassified Micromonospora]MBQ1043391.1 transglycosylase SLT domain-containing protein [Micromonospora sp. C72]MBQ1053700.1 transglycosylase SLT domain-containing protein [Micromonospora sp. C32]
MRRGLGRWAAVAVAALLATGTLTACGEQERPVREVAADLPTAAPADEPQEAPADAPSEEPPAVAAMGGRPSPSASASRAKPPRTSTKPLARPDPPTETRLPPEPPKDVDEGCKPSYRGTKASRSQVKAALADAAARTYWPTSAPDIRIPSALLKATAWQESGWQSNIIACDTGIGLMQVMPDTAEWMNQRFGQSYDVEDYRDNAYLGGSYLAWLTKYIGDMYFKADYRLDASLCTAQLDSCLLNAVIAAYNFGHGKVAQKDMPLAIPNPQYVRNVRALMTECECLSF